jgi:hypothetical protein
MSEDKDKKKVSTAEALEGVLLKDLSNSLKDFKSLLLSLNESGSLDRHLTSHRLRIKIEKLNMHIYLLKQVFIE